MRELHDIVQTLVARLQRHYVFPDIAAQASQRLLDKLNQGGYEAADTPVALATSLTEDLQKWTSDKHVRVRVTHDAKVEESDDDGDIALTPEVLQEMKGEMAEQNFGFRRAERLDGNIGYIDLQYFAPAEIASETAAAAMNFIAHTDGLILDLRQNRGGIPSMVDLICGYLFRPSVHVNSTYWRAKDAMEQHWSVPCVTGLHYGEKPVYVLTSGVTFSAAEELAYTLKHYRRGVIIGEQTRGGANPGRGFRIGQALEVFIPMGRAIHPLTGTNWEGVGVSPDERIDAERALQYAHKLALQQTLRSASVSGKSEIELVLQTLHLPSN